MSLRKISLLVAVAAVGAMTWLIVHRETTRRRDELSRLRVDSRDIEDLEVRKKLLLTEHASAEEAKQLRRDHDDIERLKAALDKLGSRTVSAEVLGRYSANTASSAQSADTTPFSHDVGHKSPQATIESVVWAANAGNVDALTPLIAFTSKGRSLAEQLFRQLPPDVRALYGSPEKVYATLLAANLPLNLTSATAVTESAKDTDHVTLAVRLERRAGKTHDVQFSFQRSGSDWQLLVPDHIVEDYARDLTDNPRSATKN